MGALSTNIVRTQDFDLSQRVLESSANAAIAAKNGLQIGTKRIKVSIARPTGNEIRNCKLFAANLPLHFRRGPLRPGGARASAE